jgi:hypothetical protein
MSTTFFAAWESVVFRRVCRVFALKVALLLKLKKEFETDTSVRIIPRL